jgi:hypothetical protein
MAEMSLEILESEVVITLQILRVPFKKVNVVKKISTQFLCEAFGVIISTINRDDYTFVRDAVMSSYPDYRYVFVSTHDSLIESKDEIVWTLMQSGFMRYVRTNYTRQFNNLILEGFGQKIINERLKRWGGKPKHKYLIDENKQALTFPTNMIITNDPAFFDYMP